MITDIPEEITFYTRSNEVGDVNKGFHITTTEDFCKEPIPRWSIKSLKGEPDVTDKSKLVLRD